MSPAVMITIEIITQIAKIAYEVNRSYCKSINDSVPPRWDDATPEAKASICNGVKFSLENPNVSPADNHANWLKDKEANGWKYGPEKDFDKKEHPCCVPYEELPESQRSKDYIFKQIVKSVFNTFINKVI